MEPGHFYEEEEEYDRNMQREQDLKVRIVERIENKWLPKMIDFIINYSASDLKPDVKDVLEQELMQTMTHKVINLLEAVFNGDEAEWMEQIHVRQAHPGQQDFFASIVEQVQSMQKEPQVAEEQVDSVAQLILKTEEL